MTEPEGPPLPPDPEAEPLPGPDPEPEREPPEEEEGGGLGQSRRVKGFLVVAMLASVVAMLGLFGYSFLTQRDALIDSLTRLSPLVFLIAAGLHVAALLLWAARLTWLTDGAGYPIRYTTAVEGVFASVFAAALTPARLGGEPVRFAVLQSNGVPPREGSLIVLLERGFDTLLFIILGIAAAIVLVPRLPLPAILTYVVPLGILFLILLIVIPLLILFKPRAVHPLMELAHRFVGRERLDKAKEWLVLEMARLRRALATVIQHKPSRVPLAALATALSWTLEFAVLAYLLYAFGHQVPFLLVAMGAVLVTLLTTLPLLPGGAGVAEVGALGIFTPMAPGLTPTFILVWRITTYYLDATVGGLFALRFASSETLEVLGKDEEGEAPDEEAEA